MIELIQEHKELAFWLTASSALLFLLSLSIIPFLLVRIPSDYFIIRYQKEKKLWNIPKSLRLFLFILKNIFGIILLLCGIAMLLLPGQGILTILLAVVFLDFPGKHKFEYWLISRPAVLKTINKMRQKAKRPPLELEKK